jgi:hypothetical protein
MKIAAHVFEATPFQLALVGFEVEFGDISSEKLRLTGIPKQRSEGFLWRVDQQLRWYPATPSISSE